MLIRKTLRISETTRITIYFADYGISNVTLDPREATRFGTREDAFIAVYNAFDDNEGWEIHYGE